jgi:hypothetical protein
MSLPVDALLCHDFNCRNAEHHLSLNQYVDDITDTCLYTLALKLSLKQLADQGAIAYQDGLNLLSRRGNGLYSGMHCGLTVIDPKTE